MYGAAGPDIDGCCRHYGHGLGRWCLNMGVGAFGLVAAIVVVAVFIQIERRGNLLQAAICNNTGARGSARLWCGNGNSVVPSSRLGALQPMRRAERGE